ncbi:MAG: hypothetical protein WBN48_20025, partial [Thiogranum sp.]
DPSRPGAHELNTSTGNDISLDKSGDGLFACAVIPGRQWISLPGCRHAGASQDKAEKDAQSR